MFARRIGGASPNQDFVCRDLKPDLEDRRRGNAQTRPIGEKTEDHVKKTALILAALVLGSVSFRAQAQQGRFELTPMIGWRLNSDISETDVARYSQLKFEDSATFGLAMSWNTSRVIRRARVHLRLVRRDGRRAHGGRRPDGQHQAARHPRQRPLPSTRATTIKPFLLGGIGVSILAPTTSTPSRTSRSRSGRLQVLRERPLWIRGDIR